MIVWEKDCIKNYLKNLIAITKLALIFNINKKLLNIIL